MPKTAAKSVVPQVLPNFTPGSRRTVAFLVGELKKHCTEQDIKLQRAVARLEKASRKNLKRICKQSRETTERLLAELATAQHMELRQLQVESAHAEKTNMHWTDLIGIITTPYQKLVAADALETQARAGNLPEPSAEQKGKLNPKPKSKVHSRLVNIVPS
jgi:predicted component of viral defense system (DUF524 family)